MTKIAINGFGRIGRLVLRCGVEDPNLEFVAINDLVTPDNLAYLFKYDSTHGRFKGTVDHDDSNIIINGKKIKCLSEKEPEKLPWKAMGVDYVVESTGRFTDQESAGKHLTAGAKKVVISAPAKDKSVPTFVMGVNESKYVGSKDNIVSNASCTTNCLAPLIKVVLDNWGIEQVFMSTVHAYTADQNLQDAPHKDLRRARSAAMNIVPTSTGAGDALVIIFPEMKGKISASSMRVPVVTGSIVEMIVVTQKVPANIEEINLVFKNASEGHFKGILQYSEEELVSTDIIGNPHSSIFDAGLTTLNSNMLKVTAWYDNEAGYSARLAEVAVF
jgi:glyceraldehyde 3-phosphate dehydrogenase